MTTSIRSRVDEALERVDALTMRERAIAFCVSLGVLVYAWHAFAYAPLDDRRAALEVEIEGLRGELAELNGQTDALARLRAEDPDAEGRTRLAELRAEAEGAREALLGVAEHLVPPREMAKVLEAVLTRESGLRLVSLESLGSQAVASTAEEVLVDAVSEAIETATGQTAAGRAPAAPGTEAAITLFRHGLEVRLEGGYLDTMRYLQALEALSWRFLWDSVTVDVVEHPTAEVTITVYSMSLDESWMGV